MRVKRSYGTIEVASMRQMRRAWRVVGATRQGNYVFAPAGEMWRDSSRESLSLYFDDRASTMRVILGGLQNESLR